MVGVVATVSELDEDVGVLVVDPSVEDLGQHFLVLDSLEFLLSVDHVGVDSVAYQFGMFGHFPDPDYSSGGDVLAGVDSFPLNGAAFDLAGKSKRHFLV